MKQKEIDSKGNNKKNRQIHSHCGDFWNSSLSVIDRTNGQNIKQDIDLSNTNNPFDSEDIELYTQQLQDNLASASTHGTSTK